MSSKLTEVFKKYLSQAPVDVYALANELGVRVIERPMAEERSGVLRKGPDGTLVCEVNSSHPYVRRRFTVAHELGHAILHDHLIGDGIYDTAYRADDGSENPNIRQYHETEANKFAASILMPESLVIEKMKLHDGDRTRVARELHVSEEALGYRLQSVN